MPMIIVEGIDGAGKSTLVERIVDLSPSPVRVIHRGPIESPVESEYVLPIFNVRDDELLVVDRWHISEMVYGPIYRGVSLVDDKYEKIIEDALDFINAVKVILLPPVDVITSRLGVRGEDYLKPEHIQRVWDSYLSYGQKHGYNIILREFDTDKLAKEIIESAFQL